MIQIRGTLKSWTKLWCVLKPGVLLIYKTHKNGQWVGTVLLNACELIERPSKKDGFCFKLFHPLEQSIWAVKVRINLQIQDLQPSVVFRSIMNHSGVTYQVIQIGERERRIYIRENVRMPNIPKLGCLFLLQTLLSLISHQLYSSW